MYLFNVIFLFSCFNSEEIPDDRAGSYVEALDRVVSKYNPQLVMCVVPNNRAERYSAIKKKACVDRSGMCSNQQSLETICFQLMSWKTIRMQLELYLE